MSDSRIRSFIAVELSYAARIEAGRLISAVEKTGIQGVRAVRPEGIHLTLRFLGDVESDAIPRVISSIRAAVAQSQPFELALNAVGAFPNTASATVLWVGVDGDMSSLSDLHENVESELSNVGFRRDRRRFNPHITLARIRDRVTRTDRRRLFETVFAVSHDRVQFEVKAVTLFKTTLHPEGSIHTALHRARLGE